MLVLCVEAIILCSL